MRRLWFYVRRYSILIPFKLTTVSEKLNINHILHIIGYISVICVCLNVAWISKMSVQCSSLVVFGCMILKINCQILVCLISYFRFLLNFYVLLCVSCTTEKHLLSLPYWCLIIDKIDQTNFRLFDSKCLLWRFK